MKFTLIFVAMVLSGCSSSSSVDTETFITGKEVEPLYGCKELRKRDPEANC